MFKTIKAWLLITLAIAITPLTFGQVPTVLYSAQMLAAAKTRIVNQGPYYNVGTAVSGYLNSPADGLRMVQNSAEFMSQPLWSGPGRTYGWDASKRAFTYYAPGTTGAPLFASVFTGNPSKRADDEGSPNQHMEYAKSAAFLYAIDTAAYKAQGLKVKTAVLATVRVRLKEDSVSRTTYMPNWGDSKNPIKGVDFENHVQHSAWVTRVAFCYDCTRPLYTASERSEIEGWLIGQAYFVGNREIYHPFKALASYPDMLTGNFATKRYLAQSTLPGGVTDFYSKAQASNPREKPYADAADTRGYMYLYRKADGSLGPQSAKSHTNIGNNRSCIKMLMVLTVGSICNEPTLYNFGKRYCQLVLVNNTYPNGDPTEMYRAGDYNVMGEGWAYQSHVTMLVLYGHIFGGRRGDYELWNWKTNEGCHGTQVPPGSPPKSFSIMADRFIELTTTQSIYWGTVAVKNKIIELKPSPGPGQRAEELPHNRYFLGIWYKFYPKTNYLTAAKGLFPGQTKWQASSSGYGFRNNGPIPNAFEGAYAEGVGVHLTVFDNYNVPWFPSEMNTSVTGTGMYSSTTKTVVLGSPDPTTNSWVPVSLPNFGNGIGLGNTNQQALSVSSTVAGGALPSGVYQFTLKTSTQTYQVSFQVSN
jgi:hypothetical protein